MSATLRRSSSLPEGSRVFSGSLEIKTSTEDLLHLEPGQRSKEQNDFRSQLQNKVCNVFRRIPQIQFQLVLVVIFIIIFSLVICTYYYSHLQKRETALRDRIVIDGRNLNLLGPTGSTLLRASLGLGFSEDTLGYDCKLLYPGNACTEWKYKARLRVNYSTPEDGFNCYSFKWESLAVGDPLKDCLVLRGAKWYGLGDTQNSSWPLKEITKTMIPFVTSQEELGSIIERYLVSSSGVGIWIDPSIPLYFSLNSSHLCLESRAKEFPYLSTRVPKLKYHLCSGKDVRQVHEKMRAKFFPEITNETTSLPFMEQPIWATSPKLGPVLTQEMLQTYADHITEYEYRIPNGWILIEPGWQGGEGDFTFNNSTFSNPQEIIHILHNKGFKVIMNINPYICLKSESFEYGSDEQLFITGSSLDVPLLNRWDSNICATLDFSNPVSREWFYEKLKYLQTTFAIDGFFFSGGETSNFPNSLIFPDYVTNPDLIIPPYLVKKVAGSSLAFRSQNAFDFVRIKTRPSTWEGLRSIIPSVFSVGLIGYPWINTGSVGGETNSKPQKELYLRWLQLTAFLPVVQFSVPPGDYDLDVIKAAKVLFKVREDKVLPALRSAHKEYIRTGQPIIRPLWWLAPNDPSALVTDSQFLIGENIIVAPMLEEGAKTRDIYLPPGMWYDEVQGQKQRGGKWIYNYQVPLDKIIYFSKTKDNS